MIETKRVAVIWTSQIHLFFRVSRAHYLDTWHLWWGPWLHHNSQGAFNWLAILPKGQLSLVYQQRADRNTVENKRWPFKRTKTKGPTRLIAKTLYLRLPVMFPVTFHERDASLTYAELNCSKWIGTQPSILRQKIVGLATIRLGTRQIT